MKENRLLFRAAEEPPLGEKGPEGNPIFHLAKRVMGEGMAALLVKGATEVGPIQDEKAAPGGREETAPEIPCDSCKYWNNPEFFEVFQNDRGEKGEFSRAERAERTQELAPGITVLRDVKLTFYRITQEDLQQANPIKYIIGKLSALEEFSYLATDIPADRPGGTYGFNNLKKAYLKVGMYIPIPIPKVERMIPDEDIFAYFTKGLEEMKKDPTYQREVEMLLKYLPEKELLALMYTVCRHESAGPSQRLGEYTFFRYESLGAAFKGFSYSMAHVLMVDAGLTARRTLGLTEGQLYHPSNTAKIFIAFLIEKCRIIARIKKTELEEQFKRIFPLKVDSSGVLERTSLREFLRVYNGGIRPDYVQSMDKYYLDYLERLQDGEFPLTLGSVETTPEKSVESLPELATEPTPEPAPLPTPEPAPAPKADVSLPTKPDVISEDQPDEIVWARARGTIIKTLTDAHYNYCQDNQIEAVIKTQVHLEDLASALQEIITEKFGYPTFFRTDEIGFSIVNDEPVIFFKRGQTILRLSAQVSSL